MKRLSDRLAYVNNYLFRKTSWIWTIAKLMRKYQIDVQILPRNDGGANIIHIRPEHN